MSLAYNNYLEEHIDNVGRAYGWFKEYLPEVVESISDDEEWAILNLHDESKCDLEEYDAYDDYVYGKKRTPEVKEAFNYAWLHHIRENGHHWQHWVLINDEADDGNVALDMPHQYIVEMICDWWSFGWRTGNLREIFSWYHIHKDMILSEKTRETVEDILGRIADKLNKLDKLNELNEPEAEGDDD